MLLIIIVFILFKACGFWLCGVPKAQVGYFECQVRMLRAT